MLFTLVTQEMDMNSKFSMPPYRNMFGVIPIMAAVFSLFLIVGIALPVIPLQVHDTLGFGSFVVGIVTGIQFLTSLISRVWAGNFSDLKGGKSAVIYGMFGAAIAGCCYLLSIYLPISHGFSVTILAIGRGILGGAESFVITGALSWSIAVAGSHQTGKVIAWVGTAMYAAFAAGAPIGMLLFSHYSFGLIASLTLVIPLIAVASVISLASPPLSHPAKSGSSFRTVIKHVWQPGFGLALTSLGFGCMTAFSTLLFIMRHWDSAWLGFSLFAAAFILIRLILGGLTDRVGGAQVAFVCIFIEAIGLLMIGFADEPNTALIGCTLTGIGYSLVYPGLGIEAVRRVNLGNRGLAMGLYTAFLDLTLGLAIPILGFVADHSQLSFVFLISAVLVGMASFISIRLIRINKISKTNNIELSV